MAGCVRWCAHPPELGRLLQNTLSSQRSSHDPPLPGSKRTDYLQTALIWVCLVVGGILIGVFAVLEPALAILSILGLAALPWAIGHIPIVILLLAAYTPFEEFILKWLPGSMASALRFAPEALILLLLVALLLRNVREGIWWKKTPLDLPAGLFLLFSGLSALAYEVPAPVWILGIREFARYLLLYYLVVNVGLTYKAMKVLTGVLLAAAVVEAGIGLMQVILGTQFSLLLVPQDVVVGEVLVREGFTQIMSGGTRIFGTLGRYSRFGLYLGIFILLASGLYLGLRRQLTNTQKVGFAAFAAVVAPAMVLSFSRTSWLAMYAGGLVLLALFRWKKMLLAALLLPVVVTALLLSSVVIEDWRTGQAEEASLTERFASTFSPEYLDVLFTRGRLFIVTRVAPIVLREYTWLGVGPGTMGSIATGAGTNSPGMFPQYSHEDWLDVSQVGRVASLRFLHDVGWASILTQVGLLGTAAYLWTIFELARTALRLFVRVDDAFARSLSAGYLALVVAVALSNFAVFSLSLRAISMYLWLFGGVLTVHLLHVGNEHSSPSLRLGGAMAGGGTPGGHG